MKTLKLNDIKNSKYDDFSIININTNLSLKYKNEDFVIDTETLFKNCDIYQQNNIPKIKMIFNNESNDLLETIKLLYDKISYVIKKNDDIILSHIINPIYKSNNNKEMLFSIINTKTIIKNIENDDLMKLSELNDKTFDIYPILYCLNMNLYDDKLYINFSFHTIFIKLIEKHNIDINYDKIKKLMK